MTVGTGSPITCICGESSEQTSRPNIDFKQPRAGPSISLSGQHSMSRRGICRTGIPVQFPQLSMARPKRVTEDAGTTPAETPAATDAAPASQDAKRRPLKTFRSGNASATVWPRKAVIRGEECTFYSVSAERSYKLPGQPWKYTRSFDAADLGDLVKVVQQADEFILDLQQQEAAK